MEGGAPSKRRKSISQKKGKAKVGEPSRAEIQSEEEEEVPTIQALTRREWIAVMANKEAVICERDINKKGIEDDEVLSVLHHRRGLHNFFIHNYKVLGYSLWMVQSFYAYMEVDREASTITSKVQDRTVVVTPDAIAHYLDYRRPSTFTYPMRPHECLFELDVLVRELCIRRSAFQGYFTLGNLKPHYRFLNKIVHYNIYPRGNEKKPGFREADLLYAFMKSDMEIDFAMWIWEEMADFRSTINFKSAMPYVAMVTQFVIQAHGTRYLREPLTPGKPGTISRATLNKAEAAASSSKVVYPRNYEPKGRSAIERVEKIVKALFCRQTEVIDTQKLHGRRVRQLEKENRERKKEQAKILSRMEFCVKSSEEQYGTKYSSPERPYEEHEAETSSGDEEEEEEEIGGSDDEGHAFGTGLDE